MYLKIMESPVEYLLSKRGAEGSSPFKARDCDRLFGKHAASLAVDHDHRSHVPEQGGVFCN